MLVPEGVEGVGVEGELLGHEADLDDGADAGGEEPVVDLVDVGEVVDGVAVLVLGVDAELIVEDGVEADVAEVGDGFDGAEVVHVAAAEDKGGAAGAEHGLPEVREGGGGGVGVDGDVLLGEEAAGRGGKEEGGGGEGAGEGAEGRGHEVGVEAAKRRGCAETRAPSGVSNGRGV